MTEPYDGAALRRLSDLHGYMEVEDEMFPVLDPKVSVDAPVFDAWICEAGLKKFIRPAHKSDSWDGYILVVELEPGVLIRRQVDVPEESP